MRFKVIKAGGFGCLRNWQSPDLDRNMVVIYGRNETGKSTLFNLIATLFYGWSPASRDSNPYVPWDGTTAAVEAVLTTEDGQELNVYRQLRSRAEGTLTAGENSFNLGNGSLAQLAFLPREIFAEAYALTVDQLRFPDAGAWQRLQDQLLGGQYGSFLRPVYAVISELESEAGNCWRPDRRGNPRAKQLQETIRALMQRRHQAEADEEALRQLEARLVELNRDLEKLLAKKTGIAAYLNRSQRLYPVLKKLKYIEELTLRAGDVAAYECLPADPQQVLTGMEERLKNLEQERQAALAQKKSLEEQLTSFTPGDKAVLEQAGQIKLISKSYSQIDADRQVVKDLEIELKRCEDRLRDRAGDFLQGGWRPELADNLKKIDEAELRASVESCKRAQARYQEEVARFEGLKARVGGRKLPQFTPWIAAGLFFLGAAGNLAAGNSPLGSVAALFMVIGLGLALSWWLARGEGTATVALKEAENRLDKCEKACREARRDVVIALQGLPVAPRRLDAPEESLLVDVNKIKDLLADLEDSLHKKDLINRRLEEKDRAVSRLLQAGKLLPRSDILENISRLEARLLEAEEHFRNFNEALRKLEEIKQELAGLDINIQQLEEAKENLLNHLSGLNGADLQEKIKNLTERRKYFQQVQALKEELRREYPDLEEMQEEIKRVEAEGEPWIFDDQQIARAGAEKEQIEYQLNRLNEEIGTLKSELKHRQEKDRLDDIEGEIAELEAERQRVAVKRDRLLLLRNLLAEAEQRFREENQPDVLQKAGKYLAVITGGRYDRLFVKEDGGGGLMIRSNYAAYPLEVSQPLSRGTLEQVYLALRLALVDHLDAGSERLPLFLDEVLVNWDGIRLERGLELLRDIAGQRQVFLFTCHGWLVERLIDSTGAQVVELG